MSETSRLMFTVVVKVDEETRGRWRLAADRVGMDLAEWIGDTCAVASDPESGQVVDCRARLTTAETERDEYASECRVEAQRRRVAENDRDLKAQLMERYVDDLAAAEARVEALSEALQDASKALQQISMWGNAGLGAGTYAEKALTRARAALACPPQQRGEQ